MDIPNQTTPQRPQMPAMEPRITPPVQPAPPITSTPPAPPTPPPTPPVPPQPEEPHHNSRLGFVLALLLLLLLAIGAYAWLAPSLSSPAEEVSTAPSAEEPMSRDGERITVEDSAELSPNLFELPAGLPQEIPVEAATVFESYKTVYHDRGVDQYTLSYTSASSTDDKWLEYEAFLKSKEYSLVAESTNRQNGTIYGIMGNTGLHVTITDENGKRVVQLNYFVRS